MVNNQGTHKKSNSFANTDIYKRMTVASMLKAHTLYS